MSEILTYMFESPIEQIPQYPNAERREKLRQGFGLVLCTRQKDESLAVLSDQIETAETIRPAAVQFDFRNRSIQEIREAQDTLVGLRDSLPGMDLSIHGESPKIDEGTLSIKNSDRIQEELDVLMLVNGESYTVHPPSVSEEKFKQAPAHVRETVVRNYADTFSSAIVKAIGEDKKFSIAIENMPVKGPDGTWGQQVEDVLALIGAVESSLVEQGVDIDIAREYVGATLDVNHALHTIEAHQYERVLRPWFEQLQDRLRVVHLYMPAEYGVDLEEKYKLTLNLASEYCPEARIFIESKRDKETTKNIYSKVRKVS